MGTSLPTIIGKSPSHINMVIIFLSLLASCLAQKPDPSENPTWFIPSREKGRYENDQEFCEKELAAKADSELYQTRTSEILIPESLPPIICIIFPFKPNNLVYAQGTKGDCVNECCVFRPPSRNIPDPPPSPTWFETTTDCSDTGSAVTKPILLQGKSGEARKICELDEDNSSYSIVEGKTLVCASGCCIFGVPQSDDE